MKKKSRINAPAKRTTPVKKKDKTKVPVEVVPLSKREQEVLVLLSQGFTSTKIADNLFLSIDTVESHRKNIIRKLGVNNITQAVAYGFRNKLIE